jgi:hypothetical protein
MNGSRLLNALVRNLRIDVTGCNIEPRSKIPSLKGASSSGVTVCSHCFAMEFDGHDDCGWFTASCGDDPEFHVGLSLPLFESIRWGTDHKD